MKQVILSSIFIALFVATGVSMAQDVLVLDDFNYDDPAEVFDRYINNSWNATAEPYIYDEGPDGTPALEEFMMFQGTAWCGASLISAEQEPFSFKPNQAVSYTVKGDQANLTDDQAIIVFQFRDANGEVIRYLDYLGPKKADWFTVTIPYAMFEEGPWDPNPDVPADRDNLVSWEFYVQGVGAAAVDYFESSIYFDNLVIKTLGPSVSGNRTLDDFEYADNAAIGNMYSDNGTLGTGEARISSDSPDGTTAMELYLTFEGAPWGSGCVITSNQIPFAFEPGQTVSFDVKGDPSAFAADYVLIVFQFRDVQGEVIRYLDAVGPKAEDWTTIEMPYDAFEEGPWDANPDVAADRNNLVSWEFYIQGVGADQIEPYSTSIYIDNLRIEADVPVSEWKLY